jgi:hypothetical protein
LRKEKEKEKSKKIKKKYEKKNKSFDTMSLEVNENNTSLMSPKNSTISNQNFEITDAYVDIFYDTNRREIKINIISIVNKYERPLFDVVVKIKILIDKDVNKSFKSNKSIQIISAKTQEEFNEIFIFNLNDVSTLEQIEINIFICGKFLKNDESNKSILFSHFCVEGKNINRK